MIKQKIYSRYEYPISDDTSFSDVFNHYDSVSEKQLNEDGVRVSGISVAIAHGKPNRVILMALSLQDEAYLKLKFSGRTDVQYNKYY